MIIGKNKDKVIANIRQAAEAGELNRKVEVDDPNLSEEEKVNLVRRFLEKRKTVGYKICNICARAITDTATKIQNRDTEIEGLQNIKGIKSGAIVTSNHFNPLDNTVVRLAMNKVGFRRLYIVSQETNLAMSGWIGFLMNHEDIIPIMNQKTYMRDSFEDLIREALDKKQAILIYPEQEMWFNYRKPRPPKRGAYYYAAKNQVPVISCFVEVRDLPEKDTEEFYRVHYIMHVLKPIFPDPQKSIRENSIEMMQQDYRQKTEAYERAYGKKLTYAFKADDIAGWITENE